MRILALPKYGSLAASTRQRFELYEPALRAAGIAVDYVPLFANSYVRKLANGRQESPFKIAGYYMRRAGKLLRARRYDALWVHCEFFPYLPGIAESLALRLGRRPIVFDFDDAIFTMYDNASNPLIRGMLSGKLAPLLRAAIACSCGNAHLRDYASQFCTTSVVVPTVVDTDVYVPAAAPAARKVPVIGWIGSPSTWRYVQPVLPILKELARGDRAQIHIVGAGPGASADLEHGMTSVPWDQGSELQELQRMDIGIMPLPDEPWARGKSGFKLIQYMACGLPVVASPVGANREIVREGENGFFAVSSDDWRETLARLLADRDLRTRLGERGRERVVRDYSLAAHAAAVVELIRSAARSG